MTTDAAVADVSCSLLEFDFSGIEAVLTGRCLWQHGFSSDGAKQYIRLARLGMHAAVTGLKVNKPVDLSLPDAQVKPALDAIKKAHPKEYDTSKRTVHANNFGMSTYGMVEKFPEFFPNLRAAEEFQRLYYALAPDLPKWHHALRKQARDSGFLGGVAKPGQQPSIWTHPYGYRHWFWDVQNFQPCNEFMARKWLKDPARAHRIVYLHGRPFKVQPGGDSNRCVVPDTKVWMGDYTYKAIGDVRVGDVVIGWQRGTQAKLPSRGSHESHYMRRKKGYVSDHLVRTTVTATHSLFDETLTITMASGKQVQCSADHQWHVWRRHEYEWKAASDLRVGDQMARLDVTDPGECPSELRETAAWLGGFYDGEGSHTGVTQVNKTHGDLLQRAKDAFYLLGFETSTLSNRGPKSEANWKPCSYLKWLGGRQASLKFLRWVPSYRYRAQWADRLILGSRFRRLDPIVRIEASDIAVPLVCITTETGNFIADDLCSHNCIAFYPQSTAAGRLKEVENRLFLPWSDDYIGDCYFGRTPLLGPIHDSLLLHVPNRCVDRVTEIVARVMQEPSRHLPIPLDWGWGEYLPIGVAAKIGSNWGEMEDLPIQQWVPSAGADHPVLPRESEGTEEDWMELSRSVA